MESSAAEDDWVNISFPKELRRWIKLSMAVEVKNEYYAVPGFPSIGTVLGFGNTIDEALNLVKERADEVSAKRLNKGVKELFELKEDIEAGRKNGITPY